MELHNKVAVVTGGARGIGAGIAQALTAAGAAVAVVDIDQEAAQATAAKMSGALGIGADVSDEKATHAVMEQVVEHFGGLDILINNAGGGRPGSGIGNPFTRISQRDWNDQLAINLRTAFASSKAAIPHLQQRGAGSIINIASVAGQIPGPTTPAYGAAKAGMIHLTKSLALELAPQQVRVNAICPGLIWTKAWEMLAQLMQMAAPQLKDLEPRDIFLDRVRRSVPLGREQTIDDIARLTVFLCSDLAVNITGQDIAVDGGLTLKVGG